MQFVTDFKLEYGRERESEREETEGQKKKGGVRVNDDRMKELKKKNEKRKK